jgi:hypothetical protein
MTPVTPERLDANWRGITAALDAPPATRTEQVLRGLRVPASFARLAVCTPGLRRSWFAAAGAAMLFGLAAADPQRPRESLFLFLVLAPLVPVVGVALSYGPGSDPAYEVTLSTPRSGLRLVLVRTLTVLVGSGAMLAMVSLLLPGRAATAFAWLVPALMLSLACLALTTVVTPRTAALSSAAAWLLVAGSCNRRAADPLVLVGVTAHLVYALVAVVAAAVVVIRRDRFAVTAGAS